MLTLHDAIISCALSTFIAQRSLPLCRVNLAVVSRDKRFIYASFVTAWRIWMSTPLKPETVN